MGNETTTYTLDLAAPLVQVLIARQGSTATAYLYGVARIGEDDGDWYYHLTDHLGSVRTLAGADGSVGATRAYRPYGTPLHSAGGATSRYGFTGEQTDATGLVYLRARMYAPSLSVFLSRDSWDGDGYAPLTLQKLLYSLDNPINYTDSTGLFPLPPVRQPPIPESCEHPKRLVFYLDGTGATEGGRDAVRKDIQDFWDEVSEEIGIEVNYDIYPYHPDRDHEANNLARLQRMFDALDSNSAIVEKVAREIDMYADSAGIVDTLDVISVVAYSGSANAGLRATLRTAHDVDNLVMLGGVFKATRSTFRRVDYFLDILGSHDNIRTSNPLTIWFAPAWDRYNRGERIDHSCLFCSKYGGRPKWEPDENIYALPQVHEWTAPNVNHDNYFDSVEVQNKVAEVLLRN